MSAAIRKSDRSPSFTSLLGAAAANERWALEELAGECLPELASFALQRGSSDPDGIASIVMMEFFSRLPDLDFDAPAQMWAYLYSVARSRIIDERRATKPVDIIDVDSLESIQACVTDFDDQVVDRQLVDRLLSSLTSDQREVLEMRFLDDLSIAETASRTGRTATAVKGLQRRAINALSTILLLAAIVGLGVLLYLQRDESTVVTVEPVTGDDVVESGTPVLEVEAGGDDAIAPRTSIVSGPEAMTSEAIALFEFTGSDNSNDAVGFECRLDGAAFFECSSPVGFDDLAAGPHVFEVRAIDVTGNLDTTSSVHVWFIDPADGSTDSDSSAGVESSTEDEGKAEVEDGEGARPAVADPAPPPVYRCGPVSGTRSEIVKLGYDVTVGTDDDDVIDVSAGSKPDFVVGGAGNDSIVTGNGDDIVCADGGNDSISSAGGNDRLYGGSGNDTIFAGWHHDRAWGGSGNDTLNGGSGNDELYGGGGVDIIEGRDGNDRIFGDDGFDVLIGGSGEDECQEGMSGARLDDSCNAP